MYIFKYYICTFPYYNNGNFATFYPESVTHPSKQILSSVAIIKGEVL